jgi:hypothetical protein
MGTQRYVPIFLPCEAASHNTFAGHESSVLPLFYQARLGASHAGKNDKVTPAESSLT